MEVVKHTDPVSFIAEKISAGKIFIRKLLDLLDEGATVPFIARYRKEMTGSMDEVMIAEIRDLYKQYQELEKRKKVILASIGEQGKLSDQLKKEIEETTDLRVLEDLYLPYKPKKQTRASKAREKGLEPLAAILMKQENGDVVYRAQRFVKGDVENVEEALQGARDIIAEWISENEKARNIVRRYMEQKAEIFSKVIKGKEEEGEKYKDYFDYSGLLKRCPSHRLLAIKRGEKEGILRTGLRMEEDFAMENLERFYLRNNNESSRQVSQALKDSYKRLLFPSIETEYIAIYKQKAEEEAIKVFAENLRQLLLAPPLGSKRILAIDPGFRTGCKVVCLNETGNLLHNETIYPHPPQQQYKQAASKINHLVSSYKIDAIAIGNGTAGRETERFIQGIRFEKDIEVYVVNESGASVYSASAVAREEFPEYDVTVRGAISIGRRLMDPLAELVKIDPKSIGVGQYQHDVDQGKLKDSLDFVVELCVNKVGVNVNTAGKHLLTHISGLGPVLAKNITEYIKENGAIRTRTELKKVKRMGEKAFQQCAGFLRIEDADNPLDNSSVHPEVYPVVEKMAADLQCNVRDLIANENQIAQIQIERYVTDTVGLPTLTDIVDELRKPGRDPRSGVKIFSFSDDVHSISDLKEGMILPGVVTNITNFGAFVDIGVKQDGLVHISEIADRYISNPAEVLQLNQQLRVKVIQVDVERKRISLSMKNVNA